MDLIPRAHDNLIEHTKPNKVLVLYGPRQVGKTTLVKRMLRDSGLSVRYDTGDDIRIQEVWRSQSLDRLRDFAQGYDVVIIDEAQRVPNIGFSLKLLVDSDTPVRLVVTGSAAFELAGQIGEPLTGRKTTLLLYPVATSELSRIYNRDELDQQIDNYLVFGSYPEVLTTPDREGKITLLGEIVGSYLLKDILELERVRSSKVLLDLLRLLAFQVGNEVSLRELGASLGLDYKTVGRYIDLLEKSFILYNVRGYSRNLRKEITKKSKYYFYDTGIRNAIIANFNPPEVRNDVGALWENFLFVERLKKRAYKGITANVFFWRTWDGQEIDCIEEAGGSLSAYEFSLGGKTPVAPRSWREAYPDASYEVVDRASYLDFVV